MDSTISNFLKEGYRHPTTKSHRTSAKTFSTFVTSVTWVTSLLDLSGDTKIGPPAVLRTTMGEYSNHIWYGGEGGGGRIWDKLKSNRFQTHLYLVLTVQRVELSKYFSKNSGITKKVNCICTKILGQNAPWYGSSPFPPQ